jgi:hypothetical protein
LVTPDYGYKFESLYALPVKVDQADDENPAVLLIPNEAIISIEIFNVIVWRLTN